MLITSWTIESARLCRILNERFTFVAHVVFHDFVVFILGWLRLSKIIGGATNEKRIFFCERKRSGAALVAVACTTMLGSVFIFPSDIFLQLFGAEIAEQDWNQ